MSSATSWKGDCALPARSAVFIGRSAGCWTMRELRWRSSRGRRGGISLSSPVRGLPVGRGLDAASASVGLDAWDSVWVAKPPAVADVALLVDLDDSRRVRAESLERPMLCKPASDDRWRHVVTGLTSEVKVLIDHQVERLIGTQAGHARWLKDLLFVLPPLRGAIIAHQAVGRIGAVTEGIEASSLLGIQPMH